MDYQARASAPTRAADAKDLLALLDFQAGQLMKFYWTTIAECVPPDVIVGALSGVGLADVNRHRIGTLLNDYSAQKSTDNAERSR